MEPLEAIATSSPTAGLKSRSSSIQAWGIAVFTLIAVGGLYYAKWQPYYHKAFTAAAKHSIGYSIVMGRAAAPPPASWHAAWEYALAYGKSIWQAMIVGLLIAAGVQALLPRRWLVRILRSYELRQRCHCGGSIGRLHDVNLLCCRTGGGAA